ncbi:MAG: NAD-dependent epimerase/dehydratase family protein [Hyphomicrobiaceae bacterium]
MTGGAGFIGSHLARRLLTDGHEVLVVDNEFNGSRAAVPAGAKYLHADVTRPDEIEPAFAAGLDAVCHLAGQVSIIRAYDNPVGDLRTNTEGTVNIVQKCLQHRVPRLVYASSMTTYGNCEIVPTPESVPCVPDSYYGITKFAAERFIHATAIRPDLKFDFAVTSLRMYCVYGPGQALDNPYQGVLGIFIGRLIRGEPITIFGDGDQTRDFIYIDDIVEGWVNALTNKAAVGGIFNLGSGRSTSINDLAAYAVAAFGHKPGTYDVRHAPARPGEQRRVGADIGLAQSVLGWRPRTSFEDGLAETVRSGRASTGG